MTTMKDILATIKPFDQYTDKELRNSNLEHFESDLQTGGWIGWDRRWNDRAKRIVINEWLCTDTMVGVHAHFFDGELVAFSFQEGRKCDCHIYWRSKEAAMKVREFILSLREEELSIAVFSEDDMVNPRWLDPQ